MNKVRNARFAHIMNDKQQIKAFVVVKVLERISLSWISASYVVFLASFGLDYLQINSINMFFMGGNVLFDALSGVAGDVFGQTRVYNTGSLIMVISMLTYARSSSYWWFVIAEVLGAIGHSFWSEALEAWLQNSLQDENKATDVKKAQVYAKQISLVLNMVIVLLAGVAVTQFGLSVIWILSGINATITLVAGVFVLKEFPKTHMARRTESFRSTLYKGLHEARNNVFVRKSLIVSFVAVACFQPINMFWTLIFKDYVPTGILNVIWVFVSISILFGTTLTGKMHWEKSFKKTLLPLFFIGITIGFGVISQNWIVLLIMFIAHEAGRAMFPQYIWLYCSNNMERDEIRTTVNSLRSTAESVGAIFGLFVSGWLAVQVGPVAVWGISSVVLMFVCVWFFIQKKG